MKEAGVKPKTVFLAPDHRWSYDYLEQTRLAEVFPYIKKIKLADVSDKAAERIDFDQQRIDYEVSVSLPLLRSNSLVDRT